MYNIMLRAALMPQFVDYNFTSETSTDIQREYLLSVALEYNCYTLLQECAINWADGSHLGQNPDEGVSLSTLTEWIWNRAKALKDLSNTMCIPLFDLSGRRIDCGTQKTLLQCSRQLRQLNKLYDIIFSQCKQYIPSQGKMITNTTFFSVKVLLFISSSFQNTSVPTKFDSASGRLSRSRPMATECRTSARRKHRRCQLVGRVSAGASSTSSNSFLLCISKKHAE